MRCAKVAVALTSLLSATSAAAAAPAIGWQASDTRRAASRLSHQLLSSRALRALRKRLGRRAHLVIAPLRNRSSQHINTRALDTALSKALGASSRVRVLSSGGRRLPPAAKAPDLLLSPWFLAQDDAEGGRTLHEMFVVVDGIDVARGDKIWVGIYRVRQLVTRAKSRDAQGKPRVAVRVKRLSAKAGPIDLSGSFNAADAVQLARAQVRDLNKHAAKLSKLGRVSMQGIRNRTSEHVNTRLLAALFEAELLRRSALRLAAGRDARSTLRALGVRSPPSRALPALVLSAKLQATASATKRHTVRVYLLVMELFDTKMQKHWVSVQRVRKVVAVAKGHNSKGSTKSGAW